MIVLGLLNGLDFIDEVQEGEGSGHVPFSPDVYALQDDVSALVGNRQVDGKDQRRFYAVPPPMAYLDRDGTCDTMSLSLSLPTYGALYLIVSTAKRGR